jgi:hypothetical protein
VQGPDPGAWHMVAISQRAAQLSEAYSETWQRAAGGMLGIVDRAAAWRIRPSSHRLLAAAHVTADVWQAVVLSTASSHRITLRERRCRMRLLGQIRHIGIPAAISLI